MGNKLKEVKRGRPKKKRTELVFNKMFSIRFNKFDEENLELLAREERGFHGLNRNAHKGVIIRRLIEKEAQRIKRDMKTIDKLKDLAGLAGNS